MDKAAETSYNGIKSKANRPPVFKPRVDVIVRLNWKSRNGFCETNLLLYTSSCEFYEIYVPTHASVKRNTMVRRSYYSAATKVALEAAFAEDISLTAARGGALVEVIGLTSTQVRNWFQNIGGELRW